MRAQTPSYVVSVKLHLPKQIENRLEKSFRIVNSAYNEIISLGQFRGRNFGKTSKKILSNWRKLLRFRFLFDIMDT